MCNALIIREISDARKHDSGAKLCIYIGKPEANLVCSLYLLYVSKKAWVHICTESCTDGMKEIMSVGTRLSIFMFRRHYQPGRAHRCRNILSPAAHSRLRSSAQGLLFMLCALHPLISLNTEASVAKYGSVSCKSMCIDINRRQLRWSSPSVNWSVIRMQFFLQAQSSVCKPSD